ncbi:riboflavin synthase [Kushneria phosphatilytica]|uniref:Riboflavin synthase n=1 Tax=Kushneria phosphatilytica TaxID=657387 RepID=A0A1S1NYY2_9GAMM|nr:riboflavin synthase [Kushneria phosphatilytica]OHV12073.1 riboflavin synthase subunit alpha [Kushneria phosphatilytica]QEL11264.1 riboflavin synthase [Kushneria phosphatilytica]
MFTGIVQEVATLVELEELEGLRRHVIELSPALCEGLEPGASVSHNGCCLTVVNIEGQRVSFDLMRETLATTNLGELVVGSQLNVERAARFGDEIGGHLMSGHVICQGRITEIEEAPNNRRLWLALPEPYHRFIFEKGYIGIDGISLTVGALREGEFCINLIPETLMRTIIGSRRVDDYVNIEIDPQTQTIVETVERIMAARANT